MRSNVMEELKRQFRPEFLNRIHEVIVFHTLTQEDVKQIVDLMMKRVEEQLKSKDIDIELTDAARTLLALRGYRPDARRTAAPPDDPATRRGSARGEAPLQGVPCRRDRGRGRGRRRGTTFEHGGADMFPPEAPPVELAGSTE